MLNFSRKSGRHTHTRTHIPWTWRVSGRAWWACRLLTSFDCWLRSFMWRVLLFAPCTSHVCVCACVCCIVNCCGLSAWVEPQTLGTGAQEHRTAGDWKCCNCCPSACPGECCWAAIGAAGSANWSWSCCCCCSSIRLADASAIQMKFQCVDCCADAALSSGWDVRKLCALCSMFSEPEHEIMIPDPAESPLKMGFAELLAVDLSFASRPKRGCSCQHRSYWCWYCSCCCCFMTACSPADKIDNNWNGDSRLTVVAAVPVKGYRMRQGTPEWIIYEWAYLLFRILVYDGNSLKFHWFMHIV